MARTKYIKLDIACGNAKAPGWTGIDMADLGRLGRTRRPAVGRGCAPPNLFGILRLHALGLLELRERVLKRGRLAGHGRLRARLWWGPGLGRRLDELDARAVEIRRNL